MADGKRLKKSFTPANTPAHAKSVITHEIRSINRTEMGHVLCVGVYVCDDPGVLMMIMAMLCGGPPPS